jgi:hypothetical protein
MNNKLKRKVVAISLTEFDHQSIKATAKATNQSVSNLIRKTILQCNNLKNN